MSKRYTLYFIYLLVLFLLQTAATKVFGESLYLIPQLLLMFIIIFTLTHSFRQALWISFVVGFLQELFSTTFFGGQIVTFVLTALLVYFITRNLTSQEITAPTIIFLVALATVLFRLWIFGYNNFIAFFNMAPHLSFRDIYSSQIIWTILVNFLFFYPLRAILCAIRSV